MSEQLINHLVFQFISGHESPVYLTTQRKTGRTSHRNLVLVIIHVPQTGSVWPCRGGMGHGLQDGERAHSGPLSFSLVPTIPQHSHPVKEQRGECSVILQPIQIVLTATTIHTAISTGGGGLWLKMRRDGEVILYLPTAPFDLKPKCPQHPQHTHTHTETTSNECFLFDDT